MKYLSTKNTGRFCLTGPVNPFRVDFRGALRRVSLAKNFLKAFTIDVALESKQIQMDVFSLEDASLPFAKPDSNFCSTFSGASESGGTQGPRLKPVGFLKLLSFTRIKTHSLALSRSLLLSEPAKSFSTLSVLFHLL